MITTLERRRILRNWAGTEPVQNVYLVLFTSVPLDSGSATGEVANAGGYSRQLITFGNVFQHTSPRRSEISNDEIVQFPMPATAWGTITHIGLSYHSTYGGDVYLASELEQPLTVNAGTVLTFPVGAVRFAILNDQVPM